MNINHTLGVLAIVAGICWIGQILNAVRKDMSRLQGQIAALVALAPVVAAQVKSLEETVEKLRDQSTGALDQDSQNALADQIESALFTINSALPTAEAEAPAVEAPQEAEVPTDTEPPTTEPVAPEGDGAAEPSPDNENTA
jgi:hypothetical protein